MMPSLFIAHGSPMLAVEEGPYPDFLGRLGQSLNPRAVVLFSAHWTHLGQLAGEDAGHHLIYDFGGFPEELYRIQYPAPGDPALAQDVRSRIEAAGVPVRLVSGRGLDHGAWVVLRLLFPAADVPVVPMSVDPRLDPAQQYHIGAALRDLRRQDVLLIGSGGTVHNLGQVFWNQPAGDPVSWAHDFDEWLLRTVPRWDLEQLAHYREVAPGADMAVPRGGHEHFIPFFYAMGAADEARTARRLFQDYQMGSLSLAVWEFGA
jgi:4,5-DOPA dioxygenase extradiol